MAYIPSVAKEIVNSTEFQTFIATNDSLLEQLGQFEKERREFIAALRASREACKKDADIAWQNFMKRLEDLKQEADLEINNKHDAEESIVQSDIDKCLSAKRELNSIRTNVPTSQPVNESYLFVQMKISQKKQREYTNVCQMLNDQDLKTFSFEAEHRIYQMSLPSTLGECVKMGPKATTDQRPITEEADNWESDGNFAFSADVSQKLETNLHIFDDDEYKHQMKDTEGTSKIKAKGQPLQTTYARKSSVQQEEMSRRVAQHIDLQWNSDARAFKTDEGVKIYVYKASILKLNVDCIVSASNKTLGRDAGVARVIANAAGRKLNSDCDAYIKLHGEVPTGTCFSSTAGKLPYSCVIHAVGPLWSDYQPHTLQRVQNCEIALYNAIMNSLLEADKARLKTIALPAVSSGLFGVPEEMCVHQYANATLDYSRNTQWEKKHLREIHFVDINANIIQRIQHMFEALLIQRIPSCYDPVNKFVKCNTIKSNPFQKQNTKSQGGRRTYARDEKSDYW